MSKTQVNKTMDPIMQLQTDSAALAWARSRVAVLSVEALGDDDDGSKTFRLHTADDAVQLKLFPKRLSQRLGSIEVVSQRFPQDVPRVLAVDAQMGWLLTAQQADKTLSAHSRESQQALLLAHLAGIQAKARSDTGFLSGLPRFDCAAMPQHLLAFLQRLKAEDGVGAGPPGAEAFIGKTSAQRYARLFQARLPLLAQHLAAASALPPTLVHGNLRYRHGSLRDDGTCLLSDWDDCAAGPAGTCLFAVFDGCTKPAIWLSRWAATGSPPDTEDGRLLAAYVRPLVAAAYADEATLLAALPGAICAGLIRAIVNYEQFPATAGARHVSVRMHERLEDLLNLCDWLSTKDHSMAMAMVADYEKGVHSRDDYVRARQLLQDQAARHPDRADLLGRFAVLSRQLGEVDVAAQACREATRLDPSNTRWWLELARASLITLDFDGCRDGLAKAATVDAQSPAVADLQRRLDEMVGLAQAADQPGGWPQVRVSDEERRLGRLDPERLALLAMLFKKHGAVQIDNVFDADYIKSLHQAFLKRYAQQLDEQSQGDNRVVGDKRFMLTLEMEDEFGVPDFYASPLLLPLMQRVLGDDLILHAYTTVISLPGAEIQHVHKDHSALFETDGGWQMALPCFAAQFLVPMIPMNLHTGTTRIVMRSQNLNFDEVQGMPHHDPVISPGSCMLVDYATVHYGGPNLSDRVRPLVSIAYSKPWFRDFWAFNLQAPMQFTHKYFKSQRETVRKLLAWRDAERRNANREQAPG